MVALKILQDNPVTSVDMIRGHSKQPARFAAELRAAFRTLEAKCAGARRAGNPHAACDVAGTGHVAMVER